MFCLDCHHPLTHTLEKALSGERALVKQSHLTGDWICENTGDEHRAGDSIDFERHVRATLPEIFDLHERGEITAEQALVAIQIDLGFKRRGEQGRRVARMLDLIEKGHVPATALALTLEEE